MIKKLLLNALIFSGVFANAQTTFTVTYDFAATTSLTGVTDPTTPPSVTGITCGSFVAVGTPSSNPTAAGRFSFVGWPVGAPNGATTYSSMVGTISTAEYYEVTLTPVNGYTVTLNSIGFKVQRSATGIKSYAVRSSIDTYSNNLPASVSSGTNIIIAGSNEFFIVPDASSSYTGSLVDLTATTFTFATPTSFRFYGWNSEAASGTFSIDDVVFDGSISGSVATNIQKLNADLVSMYPNPSNGIVVVKTPVLNAQVNVFDINGKKVFTQTTSSFETSLDLSHLANGVYQLNIVSENSSLNHKVMINK